MTSYWRLRALTIAALALAVAAGGGSRLLRASISASLERLALQRLGRADLAIAAPDFVREGLSEDLRADPEFGAAFEDVVPLVSLEGIAGDLEGGRRAARVAVYGVDDRFWRFHRVEGVTGPAAGEVLLSQALAQALGARPGSVVNVGTEEPRDAPLESIHGRKEHSGRWLRLTASRILLPEALGQFSLALDASEVLAAFVPLGLLQPEPREFRVNTLLVSARPGAPPAVIALEELLRRHSTLDDVGLLLRTDAPHGMLSLESRTGRIDETRSEKIMRAAIDIGGFPTPILTTIVNTIRKGGREVPYSFVTSVELQSIAPEIHTEESFRPPIILNEWAAGALDASVGDSITLEYSTWASPGRVENDVANFEVAGIVPLSGPANDPDFAPALPGITGAATMREWTPRFPFDVRRLRQADEEYWARHGATPKAFTAPQVGRALWRSRAGALTSIRMASVEGLTLEATGTRLAARLRESLDPRPAGISVRDLRSEARTAAARTTLGASAIVSSLPLALCALLLTSVLFAASRLPRGRALMLAGAGTALGIACAFVYCELLLIGLGTIWSDSSTTPHLELHLSASALPACLVVGALAAGAYRWIAPFWRRRGIQVTFGAMAGIAAAVIGLGRLRQPAAVGLDAPGGGTGGYELFVRTTMPVVWDPDGPEGREALGLTSMPDVQVSPMRLRAGDDVSPRNFFSPAHPRIAAVSRAFIEQGRFTFSQSLDRSDEERINPWLLLEREQRDPDDPGAGPAAPLVPVIAGRSAMSSTLHRALGEEVLIRAPGGPVRLRFVAVLADSILEDTILMSDTHFLALFPDEEGYRTLLVEAPAGRADAVRDTLNDRLRSSGGDVERAHDRLEDFLLVQNYHEAPGQFLVSSVLLLALAGIWCARLTSG